MKDDDLLPDVKMFTYRQLADLLQCSESSEKTVYNFVQRGEIVPFRCGGLVRFTTAYNSEKTVVKTVVESVGNGEKTTENEKSGASHSTTVTPLISGVCDVIPLDSRTCIRDTTSRGGVRTPPKNKAFLTFSLLFPLTFDTVA